MAHHAARQVLTAAAACAALVFVGVPSGQAGTSGPVDGSHSGGDPYFPAAGNGGYDVSHYDLRIKYDTSSKAFDAVAAVRLRPTVSLRSFSLDLRALQARLVRVDGRAASFEQVDRELVITPARPVAKGRPVVVTVVYGGTAGQPTDIEGFPYGWYAFADGAIVASEPDGASTWFPCNDVPWDKATVDVSVTVPAGKVAVSNGELVRRPRTSAGWTTWAWSARDPMSTYLVTASVGDYELTRQRAEDGLPILNAVDQQVTPDNRAITEASLALQPEMISFFEGVYGDYPFSSFGAIVDDDSVGYALETQTRPLYSLRAREGTVAHELAHQWVGDSVGPQRWRDIWLNEGFASYSAWLWAEHRGQSTAQAEFEAVMSIPEEDEFWQVVVADPGPLGLFTDPVYDRGAAALHALRLTVGDRLFFRILRAWTSLHEDGSVTTADLVRLSERVSGRQLDAFFQAWVYAPSKPAVPAAPDALQQQDAPAAGLSHTGRRGEQERR
jgi:aminopeptidase N